MKRAPTTHGVTVHFDRGYTVEVQAAHQEWADRAAHNLKTHAELLAALRALVAQHDRPHGFSDEHWYAQAVEAARAAIAKAVQS